MAITPDQGLAAVGSLGRFQIRHIIILSTFVFFTGFQNFILTFIALEPPWKCVSNHTACNLTGSFVPGQPNYNYRCDKKLPRESWEFVGDRTSITSKWDLVCERALLMNLAYSLLSPGNILGQCIFGFLVDRFGRKKPLYICMAMFIIWSIAGSLSEVYWFFAMSRFMNGFCSAGITMPLFTLAMEFCGVQHRGTAGTSLWYMFTFSLTVLPFLAWLIKDWVTLSLVTAVPALLILLSWSIVPESMRWLLVRGRSVEAQTILRKVAKFNKKEVPNEALHVPEERVQTGNILDLFSSKRMAVKTVIQWFAWFGNSFVYSGISMNSVNIGGNVYLNFFLQSLSEYPSTAMATLLMNKIGRKITVISFLITAAIASLICSAIRFDENTGFSGNIIGRIVMSLLAKVAVVISFDTLYVYSGESFPTSVRNVGMATCSAMSSIGFFCAAYVIWLQRIHHTLPFGVIGSVGFIAAMLFLTLPETKGQPTPEYIEHTTDNNNVLPKERHAWVGSDQNGQVV